MRSCYTALPPDFLDLQTDKILILDKQALAALPPERYVRRGLRYVNTGLPMHLPQAQRSLHPDLWTFGLTISRDRTSPHSPAIVERCSSRASPSCQHRACDRPSGPPMHLALVLPRLLDLRNDKTTKSPKPDEPSPALPSDTDGMRQSSASACKPQGLRTADWPWAGANSNTSALNASLYPKSRSLGLTRLGNRTRPFTAPTVREKYDKLRASRLQHRQGFFAKSS